MQSPRLETIQVVQTDKWTGAASHKMKILADGNPDKFHCLAVFFFHVYLWSKLDVDTFSMCQWHAFQK